MVSEGVVPLKRERYKSLGVNRLTEDGVRTDGRWRGCQILTVEEAPKEIAPLGPGRIYVGVHRASYA